MGAVEGQRAGEGQDSRLHATWALHTDDARDRAWPRFRNLLPFLQRPRSHEVFLIIVLVFQNPEIA